MEEEILRILRNRDIYGYFFIDDWTLNVQDMIKAYKRFIVDWIKDGNQIINLNQIKYILNLKEAVMKLYMIWLY